MNKFVITMAAMALLFWGFFVKKLLTRIPKSTESSASAEATTSLPSLEELAQWMAPQPLPPKNLRDPFRPVGLPALAPKKVAVPAKAEAVAAPPALRPDITVDAILPGDNPVAILRHNGETAVVRMGQAVWGATVQAIGANTVTILSGGGTFELRK